MPFHASYPFTGRLVIRLDQPVVNRFAERGLAAGDRAYQTLDQAASELTELSELRDVLADLPGHSSSPAIGEFSVRQVLSLEDRGHHSDFPPLHSLLAYFVLDLRNSPRFLDLERVVSRLQSTPGIEYVYREPELSDANAWAVNPDDPYVADQGYLKGGSTGPDAYRGINAYNASVWGKYNGAGIGFVDLETGWNFGHEDLPLAVHPLHNINLYTPSDPDWGDHGTAVLGVVLGRDNTTGVIGIAPGATFLRAVSRVKSAADNWDVVSAVLAALAPGVMTPGDVLLIEVQTIAGRPIAGYPIEIVDLWFDALRLAVGNGMVVVEAAGNGTTDDEGNEVGRDLDRLAVDWPDVPTWRSLDRDHPLFLDSGAILVSACASEVYPQAAHERLPYATYGSRIDCYAWGHNVCTAGYGFLAGDPSDEDTWYTASFRGTSSAAAIIAGAALLVQEMAVATRGFRLAPMQVRALLSDAASGTKVVDVNSTTAFGVMPDLAKVALRLAAVPDVFIRDSLSDTGNVPQPLVYQSPDIIVRRTTSSDLENEYGDPSPLVNAMPSNEAVAPGVPNYLYVRIKNRALAPADGVTATVYWSEASPLVAPVHWNLIGTTVPLHVPAGGALAVAGPLTWTPLKGSLPSSGHGCFVAVLDHPLDPAPPLIPANHPGSGAATSWDTFLSYVGRHNNVGWRNFIVLEVLPLLGGFQASSPFFLRGAGDEPRVFSLEVTQRLAPGARVWWEVPRELGERLARSPCHVEHRAGAEDMAHLRLRSTRVLRFHDVLLDVIPHRCALRVEFPQRAFFRQSMTVRQFHGQIEVGRLTWIIADDGPAIARRI